VERELRTIKLAEKLLTNGLKEVGKAYMIVDGVDECEPAEQARIIRIIWGFDVGHSSDSARLEYWRIGDLLN
jgi:hypothetical protein